ncbi:MAG: S8 family serine peptidase, partial [Gammaproteobacteria bacterium]|nr:S8 family serine peptidase [Gemmatimonadota bacterium]NIU80186.1 S8 family serine peptidase [Gammaproteobacteria bacterium]
AEGTWLIRPEAASLGAGSDGPWHAWLWGAVLDVTSRLPHFQGGTNRFLTERPASADRVLAAAFYASRHRWTTLDGEPASFFYQEPLGDIAFASSPGPRRDGVLTPDVTAPGKVVLSALARNATLWDPDALAFLREADGVHVGLFGSSMAVPQVAGAVALLLQLEPMLGPDRVRELLA